MTGRHSIGARQLREAIAATAVHRDVPLVLVGEVLSTLTTDRQDGWRRYTIGATGASPGL